MQVNRPRGCGGDGDDDRDHAPRDVLLHRVRDAPLRVHRVLPILHKTHNHDRDDDDHVRDDRAHGGRVLARDGLHHLHDDNTHYDDGDDVRDGVCWE